MNRVRWVLVMGVAVLTAVGPKVWAEPYEAIFAPDRSLPYLNSFGLEQGDYDKIVNPRLLGTLDDQHRIISNLTNLDGGNALQLGYGGPVGGGRLGLLVTRTDVLRDQSHSGTFTEYFDVDGDGRDDQKVDTRYLSGYQVNPQTPPNVSTSPQNPYFYNSYPAPYVSLQDSTAQGLFAIPLGRGSAAGIGLGYQRTVQESPFYGTAKSGLVSSSLLSLPFPAFSNFGSMPYYNADFEFTRTDLLTGAVLENGVRTVKGNQSNDLAAFAVSVGGEGELSNDFTLGGNLLWFPTRVQRADGSGVASDQDTTSTAVKTAQYTQDSHTTTDLGKIGLALRARYRLSAQNTAGLDAGAEWTTGSIKAGGTSETYSNTATDLVTGSFSTNNQQFMGTLSGSQQKQQIFQVGIHDMHNFGNLVNFGWGIEYYMITVNADYSSNGTFNHITQSGMTGQPLTYDTTTIQGSLAEQISSKNTYSIAALPIVSIIRPSEKVSVRIGARYMYINNTQTASTDLQNFQVSGTQVMGNGQQTQVGPGTFPYETGLSFTTAHKDNLTNAMSEVDMRIGLGWEPVRNFDLDVLLAGAPMQFSDGTLSPLFFSGEPLNSIPSTRYDVSGVPWWFGSLIVSGMVKF